MDRKELKYSHLRTFGCTAYVRVDLEKSDKFDAESMKHCDMTFDENVPVEKYYKADDKKLDIHDQIHPSL